MHKELELGKRYTWEDVQKAYPGKWVRMHDCTLGWGDSIIDGILLGVYNDGETEDVRIEMWDSGSDDVLDRTSISMGMGSIDCVNAEMEVRDGL